MSASTATSSNALRAKKEDRLKKLRDLHIKRVMLQAVNIFIVNRSVIQVFRKKLKLRLLKSASTAECNAMELNRNVASGRLVVILFDTVIKLHSFSSNMGGTRDTFLWSYNVFNTVNSQEIPILYYKMSKLFGGRLDPPSQFCL